jgi:hypothetical protein
MHLIRSDLRGVALAMLVTTSLAAAPPTATPAATDAATRPEAAIEPDVAATTNMMQRMQAMHAAMMAATTPEARAALMRAHLATMQEGMNMLQKLPMPSGHDAMSQRMGMMQMMMQMMMDQLSKPSPDVRKPETPRPETAK